jgi:hypothetical protein
MPTTKGKIEGEWFDLDTDRNSALNRKRRHAEITIPSLLPPAGQSQHQDLAVPYNSESADGINNLAAWMMAVMLPLDNLPVFEIFIDDQFNPEGEDTSAQEEKLRRFEQAVMNRLYVTNLRPQMFLALKHLIAIGDVLMFQLPNLDMRLYRFDQYVVKRTTEGVWRTIIIREMIDPELNPKLAKLNPTGQHRDSGEGFPQSAGRSRKFEPLFTRVTRDGEGKPVKIEREFRGVKVKMKKQTLKVSPYFPLRWNAVTGEDYGTSLVEDQFGDIRSLDGMSAGLLDGIAMASEFRWGVNPGGITEIEDLRQSVNGDWVATGRNDVEPLNFQNAQQIGAILTAVQHREGKIGSRFLKDTAVQPTGERVTARQITRVAEQLERALGGSLSMTNRDIMIPSIRSSIYILSESDRDIIPDEIGTMIAEPDGILKLHIRAGLELLQREAERERILEWLQIAGGLPEQAHRPVRWENVNRKIFVASGLDPVKDSLLKTTEELAAEDEAARQQQQALMAQQMASQAAIESVKNAPSGEAPPA